jgi:hypothetical protein
VPAETRLLFLGVGHFVNLEAPDEFNTRVEEFLRAAGVQRRC